MKNILKKNYHWIIAGICIFQLFCCSGAGNNFNSLHIIPVSEDLGISRSEFSLAYSIKNLFTMMFTFLNGFFLTKFGYHKMATFGLFVTALFYTLLASVDTYATFLIGCAIMGIMAAFCTTAPVSSLLSQWFHKYRGTILGLVSAATGFGGSIMCIIQTVALETFETWRASFLTCAIMVGIAALLTAFFIRNEPKNMGLHPLGEGEEIISRKKMSADPSRPGISAKKLWLSPSFYGTALIVFLTNFCIYLAFLVIIPFAKDCGFSSSQASGIYSFLLLLLSATKFLIGAMTDRFGAKAATLFCVFCGAIGLFLLSMVSSYSSLVIAVIFYTIGLPMTTIIVPLLGYSLFGYRAQMQYTGILLGITSASSMTAGPVANLCYEAFGSYKPCFFAASLVSIVLFFLYFLLFGIAKKDLKKHEEPFDPVA